MTQAKLFEVTYTALRIVLGAMFLLAGAVKVSGWTAADYLTGATGPFAAMFQAMAGSVFVDIANVLALLGLGAALLLGMCVRWASVGGMILMALYYFAAFESNTSHGYIDQHIVYIFVLAMFAVRGAGPMLSLARVVLARLRKPSPTVVALLA